MFLGDLHMPCQIIYPASQARLASEGSPVESLYNNVIIVNQMFSAKKKLQNKLYHRYKIYYFLVCLQMVLEVMGFVFTVICSSTAEYYTNSTRKRGLFFFIRARCYLDFLTSAAVDKYPKVNLVYLRLQE